MCYILNKNLIEFITQIKYADNFLRDSGQSSEVRCLRKQD